MHFKHQRAVSLAKKGKFMPKKSSLIYEPEPAATQKKHRQAAKAPRPKSRVQPEIVRKLEIKKLDLTTLVVILVLMVIGLIALFSASYPIGLYRFGDPLQFVKNQSLFAVIGICGMLFISIIDYHIYGRFYKFIFGFGVLLLVLVLIIGTNYNNAKRWIEIPGLGQFQPSEITKIAMIIAFSYYASKMGDKIRTYKGLLPFIAAFAVIAGLLALQPHMSAIVIMFVIALSILFVAGIKVWYFFPIGIGGIGAFAVAYQLPQFAHVRDRIAVWLDPFIDLQDKSYQAANSFVAIGSGGFWGLGLGQGRQKQLYLPEPQNDFVFSAWCEEMGFVGAVILIILFAYLIYRGYVIAKNARDKFGCLLAIGITTQFAVQTLMTLFVVTGVMPVTGASLPLFSYGGTALIIQLCEMGILLNISRTMTRKN